MGGSLSLRAWRRRDRDAEAVNKTGKHFKCGGGEKQLDEFRVGERSFQRGVKSIVHGFWSAVQAIGEAEAKFFFFRVRPGLKVFDSGDLWFRSTFLARGNTVCANGVGTLHLTRNADRDEFLVETGKSAVAE